MHRLPRWGLTGRVPALQAAVGPSGSLCRPPPDVMDDVSRFSVFFCISSLFAHPLLRDGEDLLARLGGVIHLGRSGADLPLEGQCPVVEGVGLLVHREDEIGRRGRRGRDIADRGLLPMVLSVAFPASGGRVCAVLWASDNTRSCCGGVEISAYVAATCGPAGVTC